MQRFLALGVAVLVAGLSAFTEASASATDTIGTAVMAPYYAALLASARGDADGTLRNVLILKARWDRVTRPKPAVPAWLGDTVGGRSLAAAIAAKIDSARQRLPRDVSGAHSDLEAIRALLRDARTRRGERTADDAVTDYHSAMERLSSHMGASNEVALTENDFALIDEDIERAHSTWTDVASFQEFEKTVAGWNDVAAATTSALDTLVKAADRRDQNTAQEASRSLKDRYFDLLSVLSRRQ